MEEKNIKTDKQSSNKPSTKHLQPFQWKKGQSGNIKGRPAGKTLKEWTRDRLERMTDDERDAFLEGMPKEAVWKMVEGNPHQSSDAKVEVTLPKPIDDVAEKKDD